MTWIKGKVSVDPYLHTFRENSKVSTLIPDLPPIRALRNNPSCRLSKDFVVETLLARVNSGAILLVGRVGVTCLHHLILPLTGHPGPPLVSEQLDSRLRL